MDAITTHQLTKNYGSKQAVRCLDLRVPVGCVYGFLGRNGAGKSTTTKMLTGMIQPDYGRVELLGQDITTMPAEERQRIAYHAEGHPLYSWMTIPEIVRFTRRFYRNWNQRLLDQIFDHFELPSRVKIGRLSKGQQAQVSLALGVAPDPELLILDDPTLGLDTVVRRDFLESMIQIIQRQGRTIFFSSHFLGDVERVATRIGIMIDGVLRVDCTTDQFRESIRKVIAEFDGPPPAFPGCDRLVSARSIGAIIEFVFAGYGDVQRQAVEALQPKLIDVLELNLEDAFIEYTRGQRKSMPIFTQENNNVDQPLSEGVA